MKFLFPVLILIVSRNCNSQVIKPDFIINPSEIDSLLTNYDIGFCDFMLDSKINSTINYIKHSENVNFFGGKYNQTKYYNKDSSLIKIKFMPINIKSDSSSHGFQFYFRDADTYRIGQPHYTYGDSIDDIVIGVPFFYPSIHGVFIQSKKSHHSIYLGFKIYPSNVIPCEFRDATINSIYIFDENFELIYALVSNRIKAENIINHQFVLIFKDDFNYYYNLLDTENINIFLDSDNIVELLKQTSISNSESKINLNGDIFNTEFFEWDFYNLPSSM